MKILLVNNHSMYFPDLKALLEKNHSVSVFTIEELKAEMAENFDVVVLSGGAKYEVSDSPEMFEEQFKIMKSGKPVFGVCLGFQAICHAFGETVEKLGHEIEGIAEVQKIKSDPLLKGLKKKFKAWEGHSWGTKKIKGELIVLAKSEHCIEMVKHPKLPVYGTQFHPEVQELDGRKILENFLKSQQTTNHEL